MLGELGRDQIESILRDNHLGRVGCHDHRGMYIVPVTYVYDGQDIIGHTSPGRKIDMMRNNPQVCFQIDVIENMANWQSVIAWGHFDELKGEEAIESLKIYADYLSPLMTSETAQVRQLLEPDPLLEGAFKTIIYKIRLGKKTGRFENQYTD